MNCCVESLYFLPITPNCSCSDIFLVNQLIVMLVVTMQENKNLPALRWGDFHHWSCIKSKYLSFSVSPHSLAGRPGEVRFSVINISRAVVPVLKIAPPVAFRQSIFFCILASIFSRGAKNCYFTKTLVWKLEWTFHRAFLFLYFSRNLLLCTISLRNYFYVMLLKERRGRSIQDWISIPSVHKDIWGGD